MKHFLLFLSLIAMCSCEKNTEPNNTSDSLAIDSVATVVPIDGVQEDTTEYIDWDSLKINGTLPLKCHQKALTDLLGKPDSMVTPDYEGICVSYFFEKPFRYLYYGESSFEAYKDTVVVRSIYFDEQSKITLTSSQITLDHNTTWESLGKLFPKAVQQDQEVKVYKRWKKICLRLGTSKNYTDDKWLLFFEKGKLIQIDYWMPC